MRRCLAFLLALGALGATTYAEPQRLVTLGGPVTEIVYALGAGADVVAVDASSTYPEATAPLPKVGYVGAVGAEGILAMEPTHIIATTRLGPPAAVDQLRASGVPLTLIDNPNSRASLRDAILELGALLDREERATSLWQAIAEDLSAAEAQTSGTAPRVVFLLGANGAPLAAGSDTQGGGIITLAGGENVFSGHESYKPVSEEALIGAMPDVILIARHRLPEGDDTDPREHLRDLGLEQLAASTTAAVHLVDMGYYLSFGPRTGEAARKLARIFAMATD